MMEKVEKIRKMEESDLLGCANVYIQTFNSEPWNENWSPENALARLEAFFNTPNCVAEILEDENNLVIGFLLGNYEFYSDHKSFYLREMCILPEFQRNGWGTLLLNSLNRSLLDEKVKSIYLITLRNSLSENFYRKNGFDDLSFLNILGKNVR